MTPEKQKFYEQLKNAAIEQQIKYGVPASVTLAQAWIEHGTYSKTTNNYFGIHDDNGYWRKHGGKTVVLNDHGKMAHFRVYNSMEQGIEDHSRFFLVNQRYGKCLAISSTDADYGKKWAQGICNAGYAERPANDPNRYARIICAEIDEYKLDQIDRPLLPSAVWLLAICVAMPMTPCSPPLVPPSCQVRNTPLLSMSLQPLQTKCC